MGPLIFNVQPHFYPRSPCGERLVKFSVSRSMISDFYPRSPCGERPLRQLQFALRRNFYPRSPCGERPDGLFFLSRRENFYPRSPCGERLFEYIQAGTGILFLSTLSLRRATALRQLQSPLCRNFYPRSPCGERPDVSVVEYKKAKISIHALLAESDYFRIRQDAG